MKPRARSGLIVRAIGGEMVVYDPTTHTAHCLNRTAAVVFGAADGKTSVPDMAKRASAETRAQVSQDVVWDALGRLAEAKLLDEPIPARSPEPSRRQMLRQVGIGVAVLAPAVASLVVPTPAEAFNTCIPATACTPSTFGQPCWITASSECSTTTKICNGGTGAGACQ
jgi:hypothetical protein